MHKIAERILPIALLLTLCGGVVQAQPVHERDSTLSLEQINATIAFLEDSVQVAATVERLKQIANAKRLLHDAATGTTVPARGINLFVTVRTSGERVRTFFVALSDEVKGAIGRINTLMLTPDSRDRIISLVLFALVACIAGAIIGIVLWRFGRRLLQGTGPEGTPNGSGVRITGLAIVQSSFALGGSAALAGIGLLSTGTVLQRFFLNVTVAYLVYLVVTTGLRVLFAPARQSLRTIPCGDETAKEVVRRLNRLFRVTLGLYLLFAVTEAMELPYTKTAVAEGSQILLTLLLPWTMLRLRALYREPFQRFRAGQRKHRRWFAAAETVLEKLPLVLFLYMAILTGISLAGPVATYRFFIRGTLATAGLLVAAAAAAGVWKLAMRSIERTRKRMLSQYADLQERTEGNMRVLNSTGFVVIGVTMLIVLVRIWGVRFSALFSSDIMVVQVTMRIAAIVAGMWLTIQAAYYIISHFQKTARSRMLRATGANPVEIDKRVATLGEIFRKIITVSVVVVGVIMVMDELGFDIKAMVAGVGIVGLAVGFGAQNLVRDVISGLFVIFENRIRVGDVAIINGTGGLVEQVNLRTSVLRGLDGTVHVFPNGAINTLSNMTHEFSFYVFDVGVAYKEDTDKVAAALKEVGDEVRSDPEYRDAILEPLEILGVDSFADSAVIVKARIKTVPIKQWFVGREMNRRIKKRFDELGIEIPFPHRTLYFGEASKPFALSAGFGGAAKQTEIEQIVRKVLDEHSAAPGDG
jgi:moderate conductance mechanosensitive channel